MLYYAKYHVVLLVFATWAAAYFWDRSVPYFPIEISRTGAGQHAKSVFKWGALSLIVSLWWENHLTVPDSYRSFIESPVLVWLCVLVITWFPDNEHLYIHILGVVALMSCVLLNVLTVGDTRRRLPVMVCALLIEGFRIWIKGFVVLFTEMDHDLFNARPYWDFIWNANRLRNEMAKHVLEIMYDGVVLVPELTIPIFQVTAVMQWLALYLLMSLY